MEKKLNLYQSLSLKDMCLRKMVVRVWNANDNLVIIQGFQDIGYSCNMLEAIHSQWKENIEILVKHQASQIEVPNSLKKILMSVVRPVGSEILKWKVFHEFFLYKSTSHFHLNIFEQLCWTCTGAIDYQKTAEKLIRLEEIDIYSRYRLACFYCLEDSIRLLWEQFAEERDWLVTGRVNPWQIARNLEYYWPYVLRGEEPQLISLHTFFNQYAFVSTARLGNKVLTEYFFHKLANEERDSSLLLALQKVMSKSKKMTYWPDSFQHVRDGDVICYILSLMSPEQQAETLKTYPCEVLSCLHDWPWHDIFMVIADIIWTFLPVIKYDNLLSIVWNSGFYFPDLFQKFFRGSPEEFRKYFIYQEHQLFRFFPEFFRGEDKETIKVVFDNIDVKERIGLVSCYQFCELLDGLIMTDKWDLIEQCFGEAALSNEDKKRLKEDYIEFLERIGTDEMTEVDPVETREHKWKQFFEFLDKIDVSAPEKRGLEDEAVIKDKRLCSEEEKNVL